MAARSAIDAKLWEKKLETSEHPLDVWCWDHTTSKPKAGKTQGPPKAGTIVVDGGSFPPGDLYPSEKALLDSRE